MVACLTLVQQVWGLILGGVVNFNLKIFNLGARRGGDVHFLIARLYSRQKKKPDDSFRGPPSSQEVKFVDRKNHSVPTSSCLIICKTIKSTRGATGCVSAFKSRHLGFKSLHRHIFYVILLCLFFIVYVMLSLKLFV